MKKKKRIGYLRKKKRLRKEERRREIRQEEKKKKIRRRKKRKLDEEEEKRRLEEERNESWKRKQKKIIKEYHETWSTYINEFEYFDSIEKIEKETDKIHYKPWIKKYEFLSFKENIFDFLSNVSSISSIISLIRNTLPFEKPEVNFGQAEKFTTDLEEKLNLEKPKIIKEYDDEHSLKEKQSIEEKFNKIKKLYKNKLNKISEIKNIYEKNIADFINN